MLLLRKIDCYGQLILTPLIIIISLSFRDSWLIVLFLMGSWQLISAIFNTCSFLQTVFEKRILIYWIFCIAELVFFYLTYWTQLLTSPTPEVSFWITIGGAIAIDIYYLTIYFKFIEFIFLRDELDGLTKSKH